MLRLARSSKTSFVFALLILLASICVTVVQQPTVAHAAFTSFVHPGMLHTQADLDRMKNNVAAGNDPWTTEFHILQNNSLASSTYTPTYYSTVCRGDTTSCPNGQTGDGDLKNSASAAYLNALEWYITGNSAYANEAIAIINNWSTQLTQITGTDAIIAAGVYGYKFLNAAEILRHEPNSGWTSTNTANFSNMMTNVFYPLVQNYAPLTRYANVDDMCILFNMEYAIWNDNDTLYQSVVNYYQTGAGNGSILHFVQTADGQNQESGRDQQHSQLALGLLGDIAEIGYNQQSADSIGANMATYNNSSLLKAAEYVAKYNLGYGVPYQPEPGADGTAPNAVVSPSGRGELRPIYEQLYNLYHNLYGVANTSMPFTYQAMRTENSLEGFHSDNPSYGGLLNAQDQRTGPFSQTIAFGSVSNGSYLIQAPNSTTPLIQNVAEQNSDGTVNFNSSDEFNLQYNNSNNTWTLQAVGVGNNYVSEDSTGTAYLTASGTTAGTQQEFTITQDVNATHALKSLVNNKYENEDSTNQIAATATGISSDNQRYSFYSLRAPVTSSTAPTTPSTLTATPVNNTQVNLSWAASTDPVGVVGYYIFRNGVNVGTAYGESYTDTGLSASTSYSYTVQAFDPAGNVSGQSGTAYVTTAGTNLALASGGGVPSASSTYSNTNWNLSYLNDGLEVPTNGINGWSSGSTNRGSNHTEWAQVDLGSNKTVGLVTLFPYNGIVFPIDFTIAVSTDGANWTQVISETGYPFSTGPQAFSFPNTTARYVRVTGTNLRPDPDDNGYYWMRLSEMEVYANPNLAPSSANWYYLSNVNSGMVMDDSNNSTSSGNPIIQWNLNNSYNQEWQFVYQSNGYYKLQNRLSGLYLDVSGGSASPGQNVVQASGSSSSSQLWTLQQISSTQFKLINLNSQLVVDVSGASKTAGANVIQWNDLGHINQEWTMTQATN